MNQLYSRKHLSKFINKVKENSNNDKKELCPILKNAFMHPVDENTRYNRPNRWTNKRKDSSFVSSSGKIKTINAVTSRRASNHTESHHKPSLDI